jgi:acyl-CoA thioester hydrolase
VTRSERRLRSTSVELEVPFHDCDPLGIVWHGHYYKYLEVARTKMLTPLRLDGEELLETGYRFYVIESRCRHTFPLFYRDRVRVDAWIREYENRLFVSFEVYNVTRDRRAARAHTIMAVTDADGNLLLATPREIVSRIIGE